MQKKKIFNAITTGVIALTLGGQSVSAATPLVLEVLSESQLYRDNETYLIKDLLNLDEGYENISLYSVSYNYDDNKFILSGDIDDTYKLEIALNEETEIIEESGEFLASFKYDEGMELNLKLTSFDNILEEVNIKVDDLLEKLVVGNEDDKDISEINIDNNEIIEVEEMDIPEPYYEIPDDIDEDSVSLPRVTEVEEMLHGKSTQSTMEASLFTSSRSRSHVNGIYTVVSGDTFNSIASSFGLSSAQLRHWNTHISNPNNLITGTKLAVTRLGVESMLSDADKARLYKGNEAEFSIPIEFIEFIAPMAIEVANQEGRQALYPSLMIAQAAHESNYGRSGLGAPPNNNLFGIKGTHQGQSALMWTWEVLGGANVNVLAAFRKYPSYSESLQDYANLLRNGVSWNRNIYSNTWRSNTRDVFDVLDKGGLDAYATDPAYHAGVRRVINQFDLTQYDSGNYYVRTGTFFGETATKRNLNTMKSINPNISYRYEESSKTPYRNRRVETTNEVVGENAAQRLVNQIKTDKGWYSSYRQTNNSTNHVRVQSGFFNTKTRAERAVEEFREKTGYYATIEKGNDNKYRLRTGFYVGEDKAQKSVDYMNDLGWFARTVETGDTTPHYVVYTGVFPNPTAVSNARNYFIDKGWGAKETMVDRYTHYYRVYATGFLSERQASSFVGTLNSRFGWFSAAFPMD